MKAKKLYLLFLLAVVAAVTGETSCIKATHSAGSAALNIVNAIPNSNPLVINFSPVNDPKLGDTFSYYYFANEVAYGQAVEFGFYTGNQPLSLSPITDTTVTIWTGSLSLPVASIHTLFLAGTDTLHVDTLFTSDQIPYYPASGDSVTGIRFVNLATGSNPVSVDIQGGGSIVNSLAYKGVTAFIQEPAGSNALNNGYVFEIRDAGSGNVLTTVPFNNNSYPPLLPFKSVTICLIGQPGLNAAVPLSGLIYPNY